MKTLGRIETVGLKSHFGSESSNFTPWLAENLDVLSETIHLKLTNASTEQTSENFRVDIQAEVEDSDKKVVIENQFGDSNHDHLGKIITYRTAFNAQIAIWIVEKAREEHVAAVNWLNETDNGCDFYLLELQLIRIGDSQLAPMFTLKSSPSKETREIHRMESRRHEMRLKFWTRLLEAFHADKSMTAFKNNSPTKDSFISSGTGINGLQWHLWVTKTFVRCELRIDKGKGSDEENIAILHKLAEDKQQVERAFGKELVWLEGEDIRVTSVRTEFPGGYDHPEEEWAEIIAADLECTKRFIAALKEPVAKLKTHK